MFDLKEWSDLTDEEFNKKYLGLNTDNLEHVEVEESLGYELPASNSGLGADAYIPRIKNQGECGSCWAFSAVATLERQYLVRKGVYIDLSQQQLVDCSTTNNGCGGGSPSAAFSYVAANGIQNAASYPYLAMKNVCKRQADKAIWFDNTFASKNIPFKTSAALNAFNFQITAGVVVAAANKFRSLSNTDDIFDVKFTGESSHQTNHAVNFVGANRDGSGRVFLKILNSWGTGWGKSGLKRIYPASDTNIWGLPSLIFYSTNVVL